jgi:membrane protease YdiL (CAAX protease family)
MALLAVAGVVFYARMASRLGSCPWPAPGFGIGDTVVAGLFIAWWIFLITQTMGKTLTVNREILINNAVFNFCVVAMIGGFLVVRNRNPIRLFGLLWKDWSREGWLIPAALVAVAPIILLVQFVSKLMLGEVSAPQDLLIFLQNADNFTDKGLLILTAVVVAPVAEETVFRGYLQGVLRQIGGRWCGILVSALLFAAIHGHIPSLGGLFVLAIALSLLYERTGSLWAPMLMHAGFNSVNVIAALTWPELMK